jgi:WD40 repeat protein
MGTNKKSRVDFKERMMQGREESMLDLEIRDARILEKTKMLSELTEQRDILQGMMAETHTSKEEEAYQSILSRIAEIETDLSEEERVARVAPLALNAITPNAHVLSPAAIDLAVSTPEERKDEEIQHQQRRKGTSVYKESGLTNVDTTLAVDPQLANKEEISAQAYRELWDDKQKLQSLEGLIKRLHQLFINSFDPKAFDLYIEPQVKDRDTGMEFPSAFKRLGDFVVQAHAASMLVAGDPGMGKTLLSLQIAQQSWYLFIRENFGTLLKDSYWVDILATYEKQGFAEIVAPLFPKADEKSEAPIPQTNISLPLWLWVPFLRTEKDWEPRLIETHLKQSGLFPEDIALLKQTCQQRLLRLLPIMDGWDELPPVKENLYLLSGFWEEERWPYLKVLSTCRPEAFVHYEKQGGYKSVFHPKQGVGAYTILNLSPFESRHIDAYINRYVSTLSEDYQPSTLLPVPAVAVKQNKAWDKNKAAWFADYEANYFPLQDSPKVADKTAKLGDEKEEEVAAALAVDFHPNEEQAMDWRSAQTYKYHLEHIPDLSQLIQTPFILSAVVQILPNIVMHHAQHHGQSQQTITRYIIYQYFVDYWLTTQAKRLWRDKEKQWALIDFRMENEAESIEKLKACLFTYSENLARLALNLGDGKIKVNLSDKDTLHPNLVIPASGAPHFKEELVDIKKLHLIRSGCLLQNLGNTFKFLHKSLVEFFAAKALFSGAHIAADSYLQRFIGEPSLHRDLSLNEQLLTSEPNIIHLLSDQARHDLDFKYLLYQIIELSKGEPSVEKAAANAITILNAAGESFSGRDFRGIHIRGAILNGALCDQTDFEGADLRDVTAHNAWLRKVNLSYAQVLGLDFQELPHIKHGVMITSFCIASDGKWLLIGDEKGYVTQYDYLKGKQLQQWSLNSLLSIRKIFSLALHPGKKLAAVSCNESVQLIDIQNSKLGTLFKPVSTAKDDEILQDWKGTDHPEFDCTCTTFCHTQGQYLAVGVQVRFVVLEHVKKKIAHVDYREGHLQLWDIEQNRFLGEYISRRLVGEYQSLLSSRFRQLSTSNQGYILIAKTDNYISDNILLFSIFDYKQGPLTPVQTLRSDGSFALSRDEQFLGVSQKNVIQLYQTDSWQPSPNAIQLKEGQKCEALAFNYGGNLLIVRSLTQLHICDLSSSQALYALPIPASKEVNLCFLLSTGISHVLVSIDDILYIWPLDRVVAGICYPYHSINLFTSLLKNIKFFGKLDTEFLSIESNGGRKIQIYYKQTKETKIMSDEYYWLLGNNEDGRMPVLLLSLDQAYLVSIVVDCRLDGGMYMYVRAWDLRKYCFYSRFKIKHSTLYAFSYECLLSTDGQWLVSVFGYEIFIHRLGDGKKLVRFTTGAFVTGLALSADKRWLAAADYNHCLYVFDITTQKQLFHLSDIPIVIKELNITVDSRFLIATNEQADLIFRVVQKRGGFTLLPINSSIELNLVCNEVNIENTLGLSRQNRLLLEQNNAHGVPKTPNFFVGDADESKKYEADIEIGREFSFDRAVVKREDVNSFLNARAVLNYDVWQVALVRDKESRSNNEHTFIVVEGMDTFGRCFFWKFDLVTIVENAVVEKGFAKVNVQRYNDLLLSERKSILQVFLNPHEIQGRGLESLVGHVWQLKREKVLDLYKAIVADQAKGLLPYALTGNQSFFSKGGDNCYSWARRHLLALKEPKIQKELPSTSADYFVMRPKWKLEDSLVAAQHVKREAASGPCRPM